MIDIMQRPDGVHMYSCVCIRLIMQRLDGVCVYSIYINIHSYWAHAFGIQMFYNQDKKLELILMLMN